MQYVDYHNAISDFSYQIFGQNPFWGAFIWRIIAFISLFYYIHIAYKIIYKQETTKLIWYFLITFMFIIILRTPLLGTGEICVDEGQVISSAARLAAGGKLFIDVDGTTQGPFMLFILSLLPKIGIPLSYTSIRIFDIICIWFPSLYLIYATIRNYTNKETAILATIPFFVFATTLNMWHLTNFNTERIPFIFIFISLYCLSNLHLNKSNYYFSLFCLGLSCTLMSLAKLQSGPYSLLFFIYGLILSWKSKNNIKSSLLLFLSAIIPLGIMMFSLIDNQSLNQMKIRYIDTTLYYSKYGLNIIPKEVSFFDQITAFFLILFKNVNLVLALSGFGFIIIKLIKKSTMATNVLAKNKKVFAFFILFIICGIYLISKPANSFGHYANYLIAPFFVPFIYIFYLFEENIKQIKLIYFAVFIPFLFVIEFSATPYSKSSISFINSRTSNTEQYFKKNVPVNSLIAIWGWDNNLYLESNSMQATAISHTYYQMLPFKYQQYYIDQYLKEIKSSKAHYFIDATSNFSSNFKNKKYNFELTPKVKEFVDAHYKYDTTIDGKRFFKLKNLN